MFDFDNTPINEYTKLKANYACAGQPVLTYDGDWARVTLVDGTVFECESQANVNALCSGVVNKDIAGHTFNADDVKKIEYGTKVTSISSGALPLTVFTNLETVNGFHEGLTKIGNQFLANTNTITTPNVVFQNNTIILPSTITSLSDGGVGINFMYNCGDGNLTIVVNCPAGYVNGKLNTLTTLRSTSPMYTNGIKIKGKNAANFIEQFPNMNDSPYRNLYNDNSLSDFITAVKSEQASLLYPIGTEIPDTYNNNSNPLIVAQYLDETNNSSYGGAEGAILIRKFVEPVSQIFGSDVDYATSAIKNFLDTTYYANSSDLVKSSIADISIPYYNGTSMTNVTAKWFAMSAYEVCNKGGGTYEGIMWDYWKQQTDLSIPDELYDGNVGRVMINRSGTARNVWLRSRYSSSNVCYVYTGGAVTMETPSASFGVLPACFIPKGNL